MRIFVLGLPHTQTTQQFCSCAYTMKAWNLCRMMTDRGHHVVHFGNEGSDPVCAENVNVMSLDEWSAVYRHPGTDYFNVSVDTPEKVAFHQRFAQRLEQEMRARLSSTIDTVICVTWGGAQREAAQAVGGQAFVVESGIGYLYSWADFRVFESYAWLHMTLGKEGIFEGQKWYWPVIPNAYDVSMFSFRTKKDDYFLYLGRLTVDKGVGLAVDLARRAGRPLILAGQGDPAPYLADHVTYVGPANVEQRRDLLCRAAALLCPTYYVEPFGGVNVEAQLSGTPVIASDYGAFTETVLHGVTGFRCRTMEQFEYAARHVDTLDPQQCRQWAMNYSLERIGKRYEEYFQMVFDLAGDGFYAPRPDRRELEWLQMHLPAAGASRRSAVPGV